MKYLGGKHGIGKLIAEFLTKECPPDIMNGYLEPFCGSLGVFKNMTNKGYQKYIASDIQPDLIQMWKQLQKKSLRLPNTISEKEYNNLKENFPQQIMHESEIIFYDIIWEMLLDIIKKNDQKLIQTII